jgi:hypothetical protein
MATAAQISNAIEKLTPFAEDDPGTFDAIRQLEALHPDDADDDVADDRDGILADTLARAQEIAKADDLPNRVRETARKAGLALQREHLAKSNPAAAAEWEATWQPA